MIGWHCTHFGKLSGRISLTFLSNDRALRELYSFKRRLLLSYQWRVLAYSKWVLIYLNTVIFLPVMYRDFGWAALCGGKFTLAAQRCRLFLWHSLSYPPTAVRIARVTGPARSGVTSPRISDMSRKGLEWHSSDELISMALRKCLVSAKFLLIISS